MKRPTFAKEWHDHATVFGFSGEGLRYIEQAKGELGMLTALVRLSRDFGEGLHVKVKIATWQSSVKGPSCLLRHDPSQSPCRSPKGFRHMGAIQLQLGPCQASKVPRTDSTTSDRLLGWLFARPPGPALGRSLPFIGLGPFPSPKAIPKGKPRRSPMSRLALGKLGLAFAGGVPRKTVKPSRGP